MVASTLQVHSAPGRTRRRCAEGPRDGRRWAGVVVAALVWIVAVPTGSSVAAPLPAARSLVALPVLHIYGDSLTYEAVPAISSLGSAGGRFDVRVSAAGGTAPCSWLGAIRSDMVAERPAVIVMAFIGNGSASGCMTETSPADIAMRYEADLWQVITMLPSSTRLVLVGPPPGAASPWSELAGLLNSLYRSLASFTPGRVFFASGAVGLSNPDGSWARLLPCAAGEPCTGHSLDPTVPVGDNIMRGPDGVHTCPIGGFPCAVPNAGAGRYAADEVGAAVAAAEWTAGQPFTGQPRAAARWASSLFAVMLGRSPSPAEQALAAAGGGVGDWIGAALRAADSSDGLTADVANLYRWLLGRAPDPAGLAYWSSVISGGVPSTAVAGRLLASTEATGPVLNPTQFVADMYQKLVNRLPDPAGLQYWAAMIAGGAPAAGIAASIAASPESFADVAASAWWQLTGHGPPAGDQTPLFLAMTGGDAPVAVAAVAASPGFVGSPPTTFDQVVLTAAA